MDLKKICRGCFREKPEAGGTCPYCGFDEIKYERERDLEVLPLDTVLQGKYVIGKCLGRGGFGITYMGWHANLQTVVAIKEFFPSGIVSRDTGNPDRATRSDVTMVNTGSTKAYRKSLDGFIKEARTLGGLNLPGVVRVHDFFEENRTAYIVMDYVEGENLSLWLKHSGGRLSEAKVLKLIRPLTGSLQKLHEKGIIHRDISPDNLILQPDGSIMLVDFGAARTVVLEQEAESAVQSMTVVLKPGYAPMEQYSSHGRQGPWTDVYAFCATIFRMLTGAAPADPGTRSVRDNDEEMLRASLKSAGVSQKTINALMKGMQLRPQNRYQSMRELEDALYGTEEIGTKTSAGGLIVVILAGAIILAAAVIGFTVHSRNSKRQETTGSISEAETQKLSEKITETEKQEVPEEIAETEQQEEPETEAKTEQARTEPREETERIAETEAITETEASYLLTVKSGKISGTEDSTGSFHEGERITVEPEERDHYIFTGWTVSDDDVIRQSDGEKLIFAMPAEDFTVTAEYEEVTYALTVKNGTGTGDYHAGDTVTIRAEERDGYDFTSWKVNQGDISIEDTSSPETTVVIGAEDTEIEAVYTEKVYSVTINGGSIEGGQRRGNYKPGTSITIKADIPDGYLFSGWNIEAGNIMLSDPSAEQTTFVMGNEDVEVTAAIEEIVVDVSQIAGMWVDTAGHRLQFGSNSIMGSAGEYAGKRFEFADGILTWYTEDGSQESYGFSIDSTYDQIILTSLTTGDRHNKLMKIKNIAQVNNVCDRSSKINPVGNIDELSAGKGFIYVGGWCYDPDARGDSLEVHVYVGGPAGTGTFYGPYIAANYREDIGNNYGVGYNHGISLTIETNLTEMKDVYVYAINENQGETTLIGYGNVYMG